MVSASARVRLAGWLLSSAATVACSLPCLNACSAAHAAPEVTGLDVTPAEVRFAHLRQRVQLVVTGVRQGHPLDLTQQAELESTDLAVVRVLPGGVLLPVGPGRADVQVRYGPWSARVDVEVAAAAAPPVRFTLEVLPALTRSGCNAGRCHGAPSGKGGFALSLRGYDAQADWYQLTRALGGRRLNLADPPSSLLLLKATAALSHGGGQRLLPNDPWHALLCEWIGGISPVPLRVPETQQPFTLEIFPAQRWLDSDGLQQQLRVTATFADGRQEDVTHLALFSSSRDEVAQVSPLGLVERMQAGEVAVAAQYAHKTASATVVFLPPPPQVAWPDLPLQGEIDRLVFERWRALRLVPSKLADDATFLRRVYLDTCGMLPSVEEVRAFLASQDPHKREQIIDTLLNRPEHASWWALKWADRLGCNQRFVGKIGALKYFRWIEHQMAAGLPEDEFVRRLITASGGNYGQPAASFYRLPRTPEDRAEHVAQVFLGMRIGCARCHNHPGDSWTQDDYYGMAAFFARLKYRDGPFYNHQYDKEETVLPLRSGELVHPRTGQAVRPRPLGGGPLEDDGRDRRELLAEWLTAADNPYFARAAVNRIWHAVFGRGLVEPVDDLRSSNPASHPQLLDDLAAAYAAMGFEHRRLLREILNSTVYQLSSETHEGNAADDRYFSHAQVRLLSAEQLLDALGQATGNAEKFAGFPSGLRAVELPDGEFSHRFLQTFGRPARALSCACERGEDTTLMQALELVGGRMIEEKIRGGGGRLDRWFAAANGGQQPDFAALVEELYLATLCRWPSDAERATLVAQLEQSPNPRQTAEDVLWALINHPEFLFQH